MKTESVSKFAPVLAAAVVLFASAAWAQPSGDTGEGHRLAATWCSTCHVINPTPPPTTSDAAPSFASVAQQSSTTALSIRAFLRTSHPVMPNFNLTDVQIDDIGAYILSLRSVRR